MLDISFYSTNSQAPQHVKLSEPFWEWLAQSQFAKIGNDEAIALPIDGEHITLTLVTLEANTRKQFIDFLNEAIVSQTKLVLAKLGNLSPQEETVYRLQKLIELLDCLKSDSYQYLRRL